MITCCWKDTLEGRRAILSFIEGSFLLLRLIERLCPTWERSCSSPHRHHCYSSPPGTKRCCLERSARLSRRLHRLVVRNRRFGPRRRRKMPECPRSIGTDSSPIGHFSTVRRSFRRCHCLEEWESRVIGVFGRGYTNSRCHRLMLALWWRLIWTEGRISWRRPCRRSHLVVFLASWRERNNFVCKVTHLFGW